MFLLDTNVIAELRKVGDGKANEGVTAWLSGMDASNFYVSVVTLMEIELGILLLERRDTRQGAMLRAWMNTRVLPEFSARTLPVDQAVALRCARVMLNKSSQAGAPGFGMGCKAQSAAIPGGIASICNAADRPKPRCDSRVGLVQHYPMHVPNPRSERDAYIAATALVHGMTVVTRNVADFSPTGVEVINPWRRT